jgi:hypothetical protein
MLTDNTTTFCGCIGYKLYFNNGSKKLYISLEVSGWWHWLLAQELSLGKSFSPSFRVTIGCQHPIAFTFQVEKKRRGKKLSVLAT